MIFMLKPITLHFDFMFGLLHLLLTIHCFLSFMSQTSIPSRNYFGSYLFVIVSFFF